MFRYELGRQPANNKLSSNKTVRRIMVRGGNVKWRALRLDTGTFSWGSEAVTRKTCLLDVVYNASNNELVRTQTLVKSAIVRGGEAATAAAAEEVKKSKHVERKLEKRQQTHVLDLHIEEQFGGGRLLACISSRHGQCGRADGYILEGKELEFYMKCNPLRSSDHDEGRGAVADESDALVGLEADESEEDADVGEGADQDGFRDQLGKLGAESDGAMCAESDGEMGAEMC
ncbi:hypothetical protein ACLB2K_007646 [Fragaria x ananassa]